MNERIRELAEQIYGTQATEQEIKFALLIVAEMLQTCEDHPAWTGRMISEEIKQHFGVEE